MRALNVLREDEYYVYADYIRWELGERERCELIDGVPYMMAPAPSAWHQEAVGNLFAMLNGFLKGKPCTVLFSPFDVCLHGEGDMDDTVVQPDIIVVCDRRKLEKGRCNGAPDMVVEVLSSSASSQRRDRRVKFRKYEYAGVREYWMVDPQSLSVEVCVLENRKYAVTKYGEGDSAPSTVLDGLQIKISDIFAE